MSDSIQYLHSRDIDREKWDSVVSMNPNGLIYAQSYYMDTFAGDWVGIVINDYTAVMPLPLRKKWGIAYHFHPPFTQQLGLIGTVDKSSYIDIQGLMHQHVKYGDILLNFQNAVLAKGFHYTLRTNFIIDLSIGYENIAARFHPNVRRNLNTAALAELRYIESSSIDQGVDLYQTEVGNAASGLETGDYNQFRQLCAHYQAQGQALVRIAIDPGGEVLSTAILLLDNKRIYNIMSAVTLKGRAVKAQRFLLDGILKEFAGLNLIFDFEGSDLPGVKEFYSKFGALNQPYYLAHYNRLNFFTRLFKR